MCGLHWAPNWKGLSQSPELNLIGKIAPNKA